MSAPPDGGSSTTTPTDSGGTDDTPPVTGTGTGGTDGGTVGTTPPPSDAGPASGGTGGTGDTGGSGGTGGTGGATPPPDGGTTTPPSDGGTPPPPPDGGTPPPPDGGSTASACDGLVPAPGAPDGEDVRKLGTHVTCGVATSAADGTVALSTFSPNLGNFGWRLATPGGQMIGPPAGQDFSTEEFGRPAGGGLHSVAGGWQGLIHVPSDTPLEFRTWDAHGSQLASTEGESVADIAPDPVAGGSVILAGPPGFNDDKPVNLEWYDAAGHLTRRVDVGEPATTVGVAASGHVLVLHFFFPSGTTRARWIGAAGAPLTDWFDVPLDSSDVGVGPQNLVAFLQPLLDGSLAFSDKSGAWRLVFRDGVASADAPPGWLVSRPASYLRPIRGGKAYAVVEADSTFITPHTLEVITPSGESCGTLTFPPTGVNREPDRIDVGEDGTVLQREFDTSDGTTVQCGWRWWSGLLR